MEENVGLQKSIKEYKAVIQALELVSEESKLIFEKEYIGINEENMSNFLIKSKVKEINESNKE